MSDEKKIFIDDDWKGQVAAEKEALKQETEPPSGSPTTGTAPGADASSGGQMPPASFELLLSTLATEAMVALGQFPHPATQEMAVNPEHARYAIDMLDMLQTKTKGNLEAAEETLISDLLHQLRMLFVAAGNGDE